jgi:hypothetical protein
MRTPATELSSNELCFCGKRLGEETLILIESGQMLPSRKDEKFLRFYPDWTLPGDRWSQPYDVSSVLRRAVHFDCFVENFNQTDKVWLIDPKPNECHICGLDFRKARWAHRYTLGDIDQDSFVPDPEMPKRGVVCGFCAEVLSREPHLDEWMPAKGSQLTLL